jgi:hypothetical protein
MYLRGYWLAAGELAYWILAETNQLEQRQRHRRDCRKE